MRLAAALLAIAATADASLAPRPSVPAVVPTWADRGHVIQALPSARAPLAGLVAVTLRYEDGRTFDAELDDTAIVETTSIEILEREYFLRRVESLLPTRGMWRVRGLPGENGAAIAARLAPHLRARGLVASAIPNLYLQHRTWGEARRPNDPKYPGQWFFSDLKMPEAWALEWGSADVGIVVVDTGCDSNHEDLREKLDRGRDVLDRDDDPGVSSRLEGANHGTACAGIIAASTDNEKGVAGACPLCRLHCVRMLALSDRPVPLDADVNAFKFAIEVGAEIVSNSWGFKDAIPVPGALATAIETAFDTGRGGKGAVIVFASGNEDREVGNDELLAVRGVLGVGAINHYGELTQYSNRGDSVDLVAPTGTYTTDLSGSNGDNPGDYTESFGGTSSACPVVAGIAGLVLSANPDLTSAEVNELLVSTVAPAFYAEPDERGHDKHYGFGIVDPVKVLKEVKGISDAPDAGTPDAGSPADAGDPGSGGDAPGCGCAGGAAAAWSVVAFAVRRRRIPR